MEPEQYIIHVIEYYQTEKNEPWKDTKSQKSTSSAVLLLRSERQPYNQKIAWCSPGLHAKAWGMSGRKGLGEKSFNGESISYFLAAARKHHDQANL